MTLIEQIKADQLAARKLKAALTTASLTTLIGEAEAVGKNKGNRAPTDEEVISIIKKTIDNLRETMNLIQDKSSVQYSKAATELTILSGYMPQQLSESDLSVIIDGFILAHGMNKGLIMAGLKKNHSGMYDGKMASAIIDGKKG